MLLPGDYDEIAPAWSPDGKSIAFVSKRGPEPDRSDNCDIYVVDAKPGARAATAHHVSGWRLRSRMGWPRPSWSPDGRSIAYVQGGPPELIYYATQNVAVIPAAGGTAKVLTPGARPSGDLSVMVERRRVGALSAGGRPGLSSGARSRSAAVPSSEWSRVVRRSPISRSGRDGKVARGHQHAVAAGRESTRSRAASYASSAIRTTPGLRR